MPFLKPRRMVKHITDLPASFFKEGHIYDFNPRIYL